MSAVAATKLSFRARMREYFRTIISNVTHWGVDGDGDLTISFFRRFHFTHYSHGTLFSFGKRSDISDLVPRTIMYEPRDTTLRQLCMKMQIAREIYNQERTRESFIVYGRAVQEIAVHIDNKKQYTLSRR